MGFNRADAISKNVLSMILLIDNSGSMSGTRITQVNNAIPKLVYKLKEAADEQSIDISMRVIAFSDDAIWTVGTAQDGVMIEDVSWTDLNVIGSTATSKAIVEANKALKASRLGTHALHPVVILITDGGCTDPHNEYIDAINEMKKKLSGNSSKEKVLRIAIGVENYNMDELEEFASKGLLNDIPDSPFVFPVDNSEKLASVINWVAMSSMYSSINAEENNDEPILVVDDWADEE